ncbi:MAG: hypothetical protein HQL90_15950 [Magnetococcales bacterium]|nr:hypothetical protein [Magnetococcales bacterium]
MKRERTLSLGVLWLLLPLLQTGCAGALRSYDAELRATTSLVRVNRPDLALQTLEKNNADPEKDLLYYMEKGELLRLQGAFADSRSSWMAADQKVQQWEEQARTDPGKLLGAIGSVVVNDKVRTYEGYDYEKVLLTAQIALDHIALGDWEAARTEIKKTHEREAIIADLHAKKVMQEEAESGNRHVRRSVKELQGYPVDTLNDPQVIALKNSYQNAFSHYLAGFVYEALGEPGLAAPGYRQAIELRPDIPLLEEGLKQLDRRRERLAAGKTDLLFVLEGGLAPARSSVMIPLPIPSAGLVTLSFPVVPDNPSASYHPGPLQIDGNKWVEMAAVTSVDAMARRTLRDDLPGIVLRSTLRAASRGIAQGQANRKGNELVGLAVMLTGLVLESADERSWRTLPATIFLGRTALKPGRYTLSFDTAYGNRASMALDVGGRYQLVPIRVVGDTLYLANTPGSSYGSLPVVGGRALTK